MTLGEQATLSLKFEGVQPQDAPAIPQIAGLDFQYVGPSSAFSFINGQTSSSVTYNYIVTAQHDGEFTIPAMRANVGGQQLASLPLKLVVTKVNAPAVADVVAGRDPAFLKLLVPKNQVYVGEPMVGELDLYLRDDVEGVNNFQLNNAPTDGFSAGKTSEQQGMRRRAQMGNRVYTVIPLTLPLTAIRPGSLTLGPFTASVVVTLPSQNQGGDPFFSRFFHQGEQKQVALAHRADPGGIAAVAGAKQAREFQRRGGRFHHVRHRRPHYRHGRRSHHRAGADLRARRADAVTLPAQDAWHDFKTYPPTTKVETSDQFGFQGTKTFEQIISPQNADVHELPALSFSFFNPDDGQYHTLTQPAVPLVVRTAGATPMPTLAAAKNAAPENQTPQDILPIKENLGTLATSPGPARSPSRFFSPRKPARAGVSGGFRLAQTHGQPGE